MVAHSVDASWAALVLMFAAAQARGATACLPMARPRMRLAACLNDVPVYRGSAQVRKVGARHGAAVAARGLDSGLQGDVVAVAVRLLQVRQRLGVLPRRLAPAPRSP